MGSTEMIPILNAIAGIEVCRDRREFDTFMIYPGANAEAGER
jgi:hypothetical protein